MLTKKMDLHLQRMKNKLLYLGIGALTIAMASCSNDYLESLTTSTAKQKGLITATVENNGAATRVGFDSDGKFYWTAGDKIGIATSATLSSISRATFVPLTLAEGGAGKATASFEGEYEGTIGDYAIYPYYNDGEYEHQMDIASNSFSLYYYLPKSYTYDGVDTDFFTGATTKKQSFNPPMYGKITTVEGNSSIDFKYLGGVICVKVPKIPVSSGALVVTSPNSNNYPLAGDFMASNFNGQTPVLGFNSTEFSNNVTINFSGAEVGEDAVFYIPAPPLTFSTITIKLVDDADNPTKTYAAEQRSNVTVDRGMLYGIILDETSVSKDGDAKLSFTVSTVDEANTALAAADNVEVTLTSLNEEDAIFKIYAVTTSGSKKKLIINDTDGESRNFKILDYSYTNQTPVENLIISLPSKIGEIEIGMPQSTVSLESVYGTTDINKVTSTTSDGSTTSIYPLIVGDGVNIEELEVMSGNVYVKNGATVNSIKNSSENRAFFFTDDYGTVGSIEGDIYNASNICTEDELYKAIGYKGELSFKIGSDIEVAAPVIASGVKILDLNGHTIKCSSSNTCAIFVESTASLTIKDSVGGGTISSEIEVDSGGTLIEKYEK